MVRHKRTQSTLVLPSIVIVAAVAGFVVAAQLLNRPLGWANGYDIMQQFANLGWMTLGIGLSMLVGEFDLSVPAMYVLGGTLAVTNGNRSPTLGVLLAAGVGLLFGLVQGGIVARFKISSVPITLGGFLTMSGIAYLLTNGLSVGYSNSGVGVRLEQPMLSVFSVRNLIAVGGFVVAGFFLRFTRLGTQVRAVGGDRRASRVAGVAVDYVLIGVFVVSAVLAAVAGALQSYALAYTVPTVDFSALVFAVTACVLGGISLQGGKGTVLGMAFGVLALGIVQEGLVINAASLDISNVVTGALLAFVALYAAPDLRLHWNRRRPETVDVLDAGATGGNTVE